MQKNWIGKSYGCELDFKLSNSQEKKKVFTTRPDTIFEPASLAINDHPLSKSFEKNSTFTKFKKIVTKQELLKKL